MELEQEDAKVKLHRLMNSVKSENQEQEDMAASIQETTETNGVPFTRWVQQDEESLHENGGSRDHSFRKWLPQSSVFETKPEPDNEIKTENEHDEHAV